MTFKEPNFYDLATLVIIFFSIYYGNIGQQYNVEVVTIEVSLSKNTFSINRKYTKSWNKLYYFKLSKEPLN